MISVLDDGLQPGLRCETSTKLVKQFSLTPVIRAARCGESFQRVAESWLVKSSKFANLG